jgi:hypothetical protein
MLEMIVAHCTGGNKARFASMLGIKPQTINTWLARNTFDPELIYSKCEGISGDWLLSGEGEMLKKDRENRDRDGEVVALCRTLLRLQDEKESVINKLTSLLK